MLSALADPEKRCHNPIGLVHTLMFSEDGEAVNVVVTCRCLHEGDFYCVPNAASGGIIPQCVTLRVP